jgi:hypothetical protein
VRAQTPLQSPAELAVPWVGGLDDHATAGRGAANHAVRWLIAGGVLVGLGWYAWRSRDELWRILASFDPRYVAPMLAVGLLQPLVNGWIGKLLTGEFGIRLGGLEAYALATLNALGNYLPVPQAGAVARGVYLRRVHRLPYGMFAASVLVTYVTAAAIYGLVGLATLGVLSFTHQPAKWEFWVAFGVLTSSLLLFTPLSRVVPLPRRLAGFRKAIHTLGRHHVLARIVALQLAMVALTSTGLWLAFLALPGGGGVSWLAGLLVALAVMGSGVVNVTPGNLFVEQFVAMGAAYLLGVDKPLALAASALYRAMAVVCVFAIGPALTAWLARQLPREPGAEAGESAAHGGTPGWKQ